jgi:hypothetical protein
MCASLVVAVATEVAAEVERKEAQRVGGGGALGLLVVVEFQVPEWQDLAVDRRNWREVLESD